MVNIKLKNLNYGLYSFITKKELNPIEVAEWVKDKPDAKIVNGFIVNAEELLTKNWKEFANWVNVGISKNEIKGKKISLSNGSEEQKQEYREILFKLDKRVVALHSWVKSKDSFPSLGNWMGLFYTKINVERKKTHNITESDYIIERYYGDYLQIIEDNLVEQFKEFIIQRTSTKVESIQDNK